MKNKIQKLLVAALVLIQSVPMAFGADFLPVQATGTDTVAGYPSALRTSLIDPSQDVRFVVEKPDGAVVQIPAQADLEGIAKTDLFGHQTKIAGDYKVAVVYPGSSESSPQSAFKVYADQLSPTQSTFRSTLAMVEANKDSTFLVATLYDQYRNPIADHRVNVISSRSDDLIEALEGGVTDRNGRANFKVRSKFPGVSVFTAVDTTVNQVLASRQEVVFFAPTAPTAATNPFVADLLAANVGQGQTEVIPGPVDEFEIQGVPSTVKVGDELSVTVRALDNNGNVAKNYTGTILFSVPDDENAVLPSNGEYTFKDTDQGEFSFDLSLSFSQIGNQVIQVFDKNDFTISGEFPVEVISQSGIIPGPASDALTIKSPVDGASLGNSLVIIAGQGKENINLKVFDNDAKIGDTETDSDGFFSFDAQNLSSGMHTFYVMSEAGEVSSSVSVLVDTLPPVLNLFVVEPQGNVVPGEEVTVTIQSEPSLDSAKVRVQGVVLPMEESSVEPGKYSVTLPAPVQEGQFPIDVILIDSLANKGELLNKGFVVVQSPEPVLPGMVEKLEGTPGDGLIQLSWTPAESTEHSIQKYRIAYGTSMTELNQVVDTLTAEPAWELRGLENGQQYFVTVKAVDAADQESENASVIIAATPVADVPEPVIIPTIDPVIGQLQAVPFDSGATLSWAPFPGVQAYYYQVFIGVAPGQYIDSVVTLDNRNSITIPDLINNVPYYFAVTALDINGNQISPLSAETQAVPVGFGFRPSAPSPIQVGQFAGDFDQNIFRDELSRVPQTEATGPESVWVIFLSIVFATLFYSHKRKVLQA